MDKLKSIRNKIDNYDMELVRLFEKRFLTVLDVLEYKRENELPIFQPEREEQILERIDSYLDHREFSEELKSLYIEILKISRKIQSKKLFPFNIVIIGMMGSGKTSVGKRLSTLLEMEFVDTDELIEKNMELTINEIFINHGESTFREMESQAINNLKNKTNTIISCGGGIVLNEENIKMLKENGRIIWLKANPKELSIRLSNTNNRPLLKNNIVEKKLAALLNERKSLYKSASHLSIDTSEKTVDEIAKGIIKMILT